MSHYEQDPTDLRGQERERAEREARKRLAQEVEDGDLKWLMKSEQGRRIVWRLLEFTGVNRATFHTNGLQMAFNEGQRNPGNFLLGEILRLCPDLYVVMLKQHRAKAKEKHGDGTGEHTH